MLEKIISYGDKIIKLDQIKRATKNMTVGNNSSKDTRANQVNTMISDAKNVLTDEIIKVYQEINKPKEKATLVSPKDTKTTMAAKKATSK